jgi:lysophospholipase L1-like esterase
MLLPALLALLSSLATSAPLRDALVGDSITFGTCSSDARATYPAVLQRLLGGNYVVSAFAKGGRTMLKATSESYWVEEAWKSAQELKADLYVVLLGTNDAKEKYWPQTCAATGSLSTCPYAADYLEMLRILLALPTTQHVFAVMPPHLFPGNSFHMNATVINEILPVLIPRIASESNALSGRLSAGLVDLSKTLSQGDTCDGCHPNNPGYRKVAAAVNKRLVALTVLRGWWNGTHPFVAATKEQVEAAGQMRFRL